jgi:WD40 repeat protein
MPVASGALDPISYSPDGHLLAASSFDQTTTLWDLKSRKRLGESFPVKQGVIPAAHFAPDGNLLIVYLADAARWPTSVEAWKKYACQVAGRDLSRAEWADLLPNRPYRRVCDAA